MGREASEASRGPRAATRTPPEFEGDNDDGRGCARATMSASRLQWLAIPISDRGNDQGAGMATIEETLVLRAVETLRRTLTSAAARGRLDEADVTTIVSPLMEIFTIEEHRTVHLALDQTEQDACEAAAEFDFRARSAGSRPTDHE